MVDSSKEFPAKEEEEVEEVDEEVGHSLGQQQGQKSSDLSSSKHSGAYDKASSSLSKSTTPSSMASISDTFSYGVGWVKVVCLTLGFFFAMISGAIAPAMVFYFAKAFENLVADVSSDDFMDQVKELTYTFLVLGVVAFVSLCVYATLLETSAGNMTKDFQKKWFQALLRQDMAYFDIQDVSGVATLISTNGLKYKRGVGVKLGLFVQFLCTFLGGFIYAFYASWTTSFVVLCTVPFMAVSGWFLVKMTTTTTQRANTAYAKAGSVAYTTISSIRTILSLNAVTTMIDQYMEATAQAYRSSARQVGWLGLANGCMMGSVFYRGTALWR